MSRNKMSGFTLIELMVVIVIIGVLASLAIPRFTEASLKAKVAEAPGVLKGFESAYLAAIAEKGEVTLSADDLVYKAPTASKWFSYTDAKAAANGTCSATATAALGSKLSGGILSTVYNSANEEFDHTASGSNANALAKLVPNFGATTGGGGTD